MLSCFRNIVHLIIGKNEIDAENTIAIEGTAVLMKRNVLDFNDFNASILDGVHDFFRQKVSFQLVSSSIGDLSNGNRGKVGTPAHLEKWITTLSSVAAGEAKFEVKFSWENSYGIPGAVIVKNEQRSEFFLKTLTLEGVPQKGRVHFVCNSWVYPVEKYSYDRIFFANDTYLPQEMTEPLQPYREEELLHLRGHNITGQLQEHDRVYDYDYYNDLGNPDSGTMYARPVLGGSKDHPYPRRGRTGRAPTKTDPKTESTLPLLHFDIYVPRDERFGHLKLSDFLAYALKSLSNALIPMLNALFDKTPMEFDSFQDVLNLYEGGIRLPYCEVIEEIKNHIPVEMIKELVRTDGDYLLKLPLPQVIKENTFAWRTDEEFGREMLAGINPVILKRLQEFPPKSTLDPKIYGDHSSSITEDQIQGNLEGLTVNQALKDNRLFILDHHDMLMSHLNKINATSNKIYATRTLMFLKDDCTLKPLAIELSLVHPDGEQYGAVNHVYTPSQHGVEGSIWQLAKAYALVNDSGVHQLISHWLNTHATVEPFVIATNRQLSVVHPIYKLLSPHYRDTMNINALARQILINADGILEKTVFPAKYAMEMSSAAYKSWNFTEQSLPADLLKRGVAEKDVDSPNKIRLLIKDYPYAVDGLAIWSAIETWVQDYCSIYYPNNTSVESDPELQAWWAEIKEVGHGDKKNEPWWPKMDSVQDLTQSCSTIIWVASALHAAVNFGQYAYAGYLPNRPTISRRFMPEPNSPEYDELIKNPDKVFLKTITGQFETILGVSLIEILSKHSSDEVYLGQRDTAEWTSDGKVIDAFKRFGEKLMEIEKVILKMNEDVSLKNRNGQVRIPYMFLYPSTSDYTGLGGLTGRGIPNSVSI
uniref:Lipoxygenase n=1 Tax=Allium cepa TaxID=4679 RepID=A0A1J0I8W4_ALLCE|nr:putative linoleate 9S-lipoxygenase [Allium cepa]